MPIMNLSSGLKSILNDNTHEYYLTGSRFFGTYTPVSDWDFFTKDTPDTRSYLESCGFERLEHSRYSDDPTITVVYRYTPSIESLSVSVWIDVQLVENPDRKRKAQELIKWMGINNPSEITWRKALSYTDSH